LEELREENVHWGTGGHPPPSQAYDTAAQIDHDWLASLAIDMDEAVKWRNAYAKVALDNRLNMAAPTRSDLFHCIVLFLGGQ
jgi:hypothetical protein